MADNNTLTAISKLYECRTNFTIVALTGQTATGCSRLSSFMCDRKFYEKKEAYVRTPESITLQEIKVTDNTEIYANNKVDESHKAIASHVFKRKYSICYDFVQHHYVPFIEIKYVSAMWLYTLLFALTKINGENKGKELKEKVKEILEDKYRPSHKDGVDQEYKDLTATYENKGLPTYKNTDPILQEIDWQKLYDDLNIVGTDCLNFKVKIDRNKKKLLADLFFNATSSFNKFIEKINSELSKLDYYCFCFLYHRLGVVIRNMGDPFVSCEVSYAKNGFETSHVYCIIQLINLLIKGLRVVNEDKAKEEKGDKEEKNVECRVVIDRLRNSLEALFLKERYSAFYLVAVHDEDNPQKHLKAKIEQLYIDYDAIKKHEDLINLQTKMVMELGAIEAKSKEVEKGKFASPNITQCIADAEIHICNRELKENSKEYRFDSMAEQWLKYAALLQHPGLITPSSEERCMVVAYTAKFNSGCLSRQVGAVITNKYHAIRTIGWNDVPYGQIPCSLRELRDIANQDAKYREYAYSEYERTKDKVYEGESSFADKVKKDYPQLLKADCDCGMKGLPYSYCFKSLHNRYLNDKNQVFTRSLHAEENAMMQMVRFGGESLMDGIIYVTASPCDLCCKKLYQIGVRKIIYIDEYPGISRANIIGNGYKKPTLKQFQGAYGATYNKLYQPFMAYKDEIALRTNDDKHSVNTADDMLKMIAKELNFENKRNYTAAEIDDIKKRIQSLAQQNPEDNKPQNA